MKSYIRNNLFYGIVGRKEAEEILKNSPKDELKNVLLISIINPLSDRDLYQDLKKELDKEKEFYDIPIKQLNGKIQKIKGSRKDLQKLIRELEIKLENIKNSGGIDDYNSFPIDNELIDKVHDHITVSFWDIEEEVGEYKPISEKEAFEIANFISKYKNEIGKTKKVLIHCSAGISRSAGVGLATKCIVEHDGDKYDFSLYPCGITQMRRYYPNLVVYDKIVEQYNNSNNLYNKIKKDLYGKNY
jgi:hypothetical protein